MDDTRENDVRSRRDVLSLGGALVAGAAAGATLLGARTAQAANETTLKIAVVDIGLVFKKYKRKEHLEKEINAKKDKVEADQKELQVRIEGIRNQPRDREPDAPDPR
ncbi:hypothetical protein HY251_18045 [bacterium]|nr:hypothetical protein [bacterium]